MVVIVMDGRGGEGAEGLGMEVFWGSGNRYSIVVNHFVCNDFRW